MFVDQDDMYLGTKIRKLYATYKIWGFQGC